MEYSLTLTFKCENGDKSSITIDNVKSDLTKEQISTLMDTIITKNIFLTKNGALKTKASAQLTQKTVTKYDLA